MSYGVESNKIVEVQKNKSALFGALFKGQAKLLITQAKTTWAIYAGSDSVVKPNIVCITPTTWQL